MRCSAGCRASVSRLSGTEWGVKDEVYDTNGRLKYATTLLASFTEHALSSTYTGYPGLLHSARTPHCITVCALSSHWQLPVHCAARYRYWIWRSYVKEGRDVDAPVWGFELVHNDGPHEALDDHMIHALQARGLYISRAHAQQCTHA